MRPVAGLSHDDRLSLGFDRWLIAAVARWRQPRRRPLLAPWWTGRGGMLLGPLDTMLDARLNAGLVARLLTPTLAYIVHRL